MNNSGLYIGDYWTINSINWRIADIDYAYKTGDTSLTTHNLAIVPDANLYSAQMNSSNTTSGGYTGSEMYTANLDAAKTTIESAFGTLLLTRRSYLTNSVSSNGYPNGGAWFDSTVELMNEIMVYGGPIAQALNNGSTAATTTTVDKQQLALFALDPTFVNLGANYWLRDVVSSARFAVVYSNGLAGIPGASDSYGVRPVFFIGC